MSLLGAIIHTTVGSGLFRRETTTATVKMRRGSRVDNHNPIFSTRVGCNGFDEILIGRPMTPRVYKTKTILRDHKADVRV